MSYKQPNIYRVKTLISYSDIDMLVAKKNVANRMEYFELLDQFIDTEPAMVKAMEEYAEQGNYEGIVTTVSNIQDRLMEIGATLMTWEAEKVSSLAHQKAPYRQCIDEVFLLSSKLDTLRSTLQAAIMVDAEAMKMAFSHPILHDNLPETEFDWDPTRKLKALPKAEPLEQIIALVENFESEDAMLILGNLRKYSYGKEIDTRLLDAYNQLALFKFDQGATNLRGVIANLREVIAEIRYLETHGENASKRVILAVDDVPDVLNTVKSILQEHYVVYGVTNHKAALKFLTGKHADLVLLDIEMPQMDGFAMLSIIRRMRPYRDTPVLFLSGSVNMENIQRSYDLGANDFIRKPVSKDALLAKVEKYLEEAVDTANRYQ
jgi:CheY-like chemotaxis protein